MDNSDLNDRRQQKRFEVKEGAFAVFMSNPPKLAKIREISRGGLTVRYFDSDESSNQTYELDILFSDSGFRLRRVPYQTTSNFEIAIELSESLLPMKQQGLKFGILTPNQKSLLDHIIFNHTVENHVINRRFFEERRQSDPSQFQYSGSERRNGAERRKSLLSS